MSELLDDPHVEIPGHPSDVAAPATRRALHAAGGRSVDATLDAHEWRDQVAHALENSDTRRGLVVTVQLVDLAPMLSRLGDAELAQVQQRVADEYHQELGEELWMSWRRADRLDLLVPGARAATTVWPLERAARSIAVSGVVAGSETLHLSPVAGVTDLDESDSVLTALDAVGAALEVAAAKMDLVPQVHQSGQISATKVRRPVAQEGLLGRVRRRLHATSLLAVTGYVLGIGLPLAIMEIAWGFGTDISGLVFAISVVAGLFTCWTLWMEILHALKVVDPPERPNGPIPLATAVIAAYLPNEAATIEETVEEFLKMNPEGGLQVLLAYNSPQHLPVEDRLQDIAERDPRLELLRVEGSTSKAQNVNAAVPRCRGEIVGIFDADHHPMPGAFERAWEWLGSGYDVVQGHCVVRNGRASLISRLVAVEFEGIYGVSHPGRARWHGFGIFGGSNGYWRREVLRGMRFRDDMLTEDIDSSIRTLTLGGEFASDPYLTSSELAPVEVKALWHQRLRWAQGWFQVMRRRLPSGLSAPDISRSQKAGLTLLLGWTQAAPWMCMLPLPLVIFALLHASELDVRWDVPLYLLVGFLSLVTSAGQMLAGYLVAHPSIRRHPAWFAQALVVLPFYAEFKNCVVRTAHLRELVGGRDWIVTPRTSGGAE